MSLERAPLERDPDASQNNWPAPLAMFIAWLVRIFAQIAKLKRIRRTTKFKPNWRDHWPNLRQLEWIRDQILAACAARLLAGETLDAESNFTPSTDPPAGYGGPCPRTPFEMNRRFLAIAKRAGIDPSNPLVAHGSTDAVLRAAAHNELVTADTSQALILSRPQSGRPSKDERALPGARGPPDLFKTSSIPTRTARARGRTRMRKPFPHRTKSRKRPSVAIDRPNYTRSLK